MVYLVRSSESTDPYDSWLCGGALVTTSQILTSAACIVDIDNLFVIAGYRRYVNGRDIDRDNCTRLVKKRIVKVRLPREHVAHVSNYTNTTQWMGLDVGVATVDRPYDFQDITYRIHCSYIPAAIEINYNIKLEQRMDTNVVALGWGRDRGSKTRDLVDRNSDTLREASIKIKPKEVCIKQFKGNNLSEMIQKYMICTHGRGSLDGEGFVIQETVKNKCSDLPKLIQNDDNFDFSDCIDVDHKFKIIKTVKRIGSRRDRKSNNHTTNQSNFNETKQSNNVTKSTRRQGICQNDHGGPLITWVGNTELLIGVAVNSIYDDQYNCIGPYLFTSTAAAGTVIRCLLTTEQPTLRTVDSCLDEENGFDIFENIVGVTPKVVQARAVYEEGFSSIEEVISI